MAWRWIGDKSFSEPNMTQYTDAYMHLLLGDAVSNAWVTVNNDFLSRVRRFDNDFHEWRSHEWKSLPNRLTSDKKSSFTVTNVLFYFLHANLCFEQTIPLKTGSGRLFHHCRQDRAFLTWYCDVTTVWSVTSHEGGVLALWRHIRRLFCTRKLVQGRSSLVNNNREYWFFATRYSRLSVQ